MMKLCGWSCVLEKTSIYIGPLVDDEGHVLSYTVTGQPEGIDVVYVEVAADGREPGAYLQGYIAYSNAASNAPPVDFHVIITVTKEGDGNSLQSDSFTWTIRDTSRLGAISDQVSREGEFIFWIPPVARTEGETLVIHYSGLPLGLEYFANSGLVYGYVSYANIASNGHARSLEVIIFVNDGTGAESKTFHWQVEDTNRIPVLPDVSISEGDYINVKINAEDATGASLTYAADNLPRGLRIDSATGRITGTVSYRNVGPIEGVSEFIISIRVTDGESEDMRTVTWTVQDKDWWSAPPNLTNSAGEDVYIELAGENVSGQPVEYRFANLPQGIVWDAQNGALRGRVAYRNASPAQPEVGYQVEVETIPDAELRTFTWTILDNPRILLEDGLVVETWVGEEIDAVVPTRTGDDAEWVFEARNLPPGLTIDPTTGRITGTIVNPARVRNSEPTYRNYSELGYVEYDVVLQVSDSASVDEHHLIWRVYLDCSCGNKASTYKAEFPIPYIAVQASLVVRNYDLLVAMNGDGVAGDQARAQALANRFQNLDSAKALTEALGDAAKAAMTKLLGLDEKWEKVLKMYERVETVKRVLEFITREDNVIYTYEYKENDKNRVSILFAYNRKTNEWYAVYGGVVGGIRATDPATPFTFYVRGTAVPKDSASSLASAFWRWSFPFGEPYTVTVERQIHWIQPR
jgi:hypothetical protein